MKYFFILLILSLFLTPHIFAQDDTASSYSSVTTHVEGDSTVSTHIETTVNGQTKVFDSNTPGTYTLTNTTDTSDQPHNVSLTPTPSVSPHPTMLPLHKKKVLPSTHSFIYQLHQWLHKLFVSL